MGIRYPLADLRRHGGNRAVRLLAALALRDRLRAGPFPGPSRQVGPVWRAAAVAELFACGLMAEPDRQRAKAELRAGPSPWGRPPGLPHAYACLARAAALALRQWRCCGPVLELLMSSARGTRPGPATPSQRAQDATRMRDVLWRQLALAEGLAVAVGRRPEWRHPAPGLWDKGEGCDHGLGSAYRPRPFSRRCARCGHFTDRADP
jgi:hypothetical protein